MEEDFAGRERDPDSRDLLGRRRCGGFRKERIEEDAEVEDRDAGKGQEGREHWRLMRSENEVASRNRWGGEVCWTLRFVMMGAVDRMGRRSSVSVESGIVLGMLGVESDGGFVRSWSGSWVVMVLEMGSLLVRIEHGHLGLQRQNQEVQTLHFSSMKICWSSVSLEPGGSFVGWLECFHLIPCS